MSLFYFAMFVLPVALVAGVVVLAWWQGRSGGRRRAARIRGGDGT